jgi:hypothetical protein
MPRAALRRWLQIIYERVYQSTAEDPRIDAMLARVGDPVQLDKDHGDARHVLGIAPKKLLSSN